MHPVGILQLHAPEAHLPRTKARVVWQKAKGKKVTKMLA